MRLPVLVLFGLLSIPPTQVSVRASELQQAFMVWDKTCLDKAEIQEKTYMDAPVVDGKPDMKKAQIHNLALTYNKNCGRIEIRRAQ